MPIKAESPLVVLKIKRGIFFFIIFVCIVVLWMLLFNVLIPVLMSGDFNAAKTVVSYSYGGKIALFILGILNIIFAMPVFLCTYCRQGDISFYEDRLEIKPILKLPIRIQHYRNAYVLYKRMRFVPTIFITNSEFPPSLIYQPWQRFKWRFLDSAYIGLSNNTMKNPEMGQQAIDIISKRALKYKEEQL